MAVNTPLLHTVITNVLTMKQMHKSVVEVICIVYTGASISVGVE